MSRRGALLVVVALVVGCDHTVRLLDDVPTDAGAPDASTGGAAGAGQGGSAGSAEAGTGGGGAAAGQGGTTSGCSPDCAPDHVCVGTACVCPGALVACGDACIDSQRDALHCGGCDVACAPSQSCSDGACVCADGFTMCGDECVHVKSDPSHCGDCGKPCPMGSACSEGHCEASCAPPLMACAEGGSIACVSPEGDEQHCGGCDQHCNSGESCLNGACHKMFPATQCDLCPCPQCGGKGGEKTTCCNGPKGPLCVDGDSCP